MAIAIGVVAIAVTIAVSKRRSTSSAKDSSAAFDEMGPTALSSEEQDLDLFLSVAAKQGWCVRSKGKRCDLIKKETKARLSRVEKIRSDYQAQCQKGQAASCEIVCRGDAIAERRVDAIKNCKKGLSLIAADVRKCDAAKDIRSETCVTVKGIESFLNASNDRLDAAPPRNR